VSILLPVRNEIDHIDECLRSLAAQDYPGPLEIVIADGASDDGTAERLRHWSDKIDFVVVDNPRRTQSVGLNLAAAAGSGDILVRADGHSVYAEDYVRRNVDALLGTDAVAAGGLMSPSGDTPFSRAVAAAMRTPLAIGPGRFHHAAAARPTDTVYLGAFRRDDFEALGGYRHFPSQVAEDADLYYRWRRQGRTIWLDPAIVSTYRPRRSLGALWRQAYRWGKGKAEMWYTNGELPYLRPLIPMALVVALALGIGAGLVWSWVPLGALVTAWAVVLVAGAVSARHPGVAAVAAVMHLGYGLGAVAGVLRGKRRSLPLS
jgi:glycosyltransferase involved in cell wall biosynthesis